MNRRLLTLTLAVLTVGLLGSCKKEPVVSVADIFLDKNELTLTVGEPAVKLIATVTPDDAKDKSVTWSSDKEAVATVDNEGNVSPVAAGTATITVTTTDGLKTATCAVTVKEAVSVADLVVYGKIFRSETDRDGEFLHARAFAVKDGKFIYVGNEDGAASFIEEGKTTVIDHREKGIIIPGCYEGHAHYMMANGMSLMGGPMLKQECTPDEFKVEIKKAYDQAKAAGKSSIYGFGWSYQNFFDNMPTRKELDAICPDIALFVSDAEGHKGLANQKNPWR